jgi:molybdopterin molybdotransferase
MEQPGREMISLDEALNRVLETLDVGGREQVLVDLDQSLGRILAEDILAAEDYPAQDNSAMDGFALKADDLVGRDSLTLVGQSLAGQPFDGQLEAGQCTRVMTGGLIPRGADAVVPVENTSGYEPAQDGAVSFDGKPGVGDNIRPRGGVIRAGESLLAVGTKIRPATIGILASQGKERVSVGKRPMVAILATGDEIVEVGEVPKSGQVRNSNAHALLAQAKAAGAEATLLPVLRDEEGKSREVLGAALEVYDLVCTIGGVSMGTKDLVRGAFDELGGKTIVETIRIKPGRPTLFGKREHGGRTSYLLGLPGNPASSFTLFALLGAAWVQGYQGGSLAPWRERSRATLWYSKVRPNRRLQALPARLRLAADGVNLLNLPQRTSADLFSLADADAFFLAPEDSGPRDGEIVDWVPLP